ncbi:hypothetical protein WJX75_003625 [Coccomyxa subellipsoidea]|uniref:Uncharacterized protein n=1 Tax=Coccomyxa subellipsoidea TaxID=248742 RepID=A0ABR2YAH9_9CHLO
MSGLGAEEDQSQRVNHCSDSAEAVWKQCVVGGARTETAQPPSRSRVVTKREWSKDGAERAVFTRKQGSSGVDMQCSGTGVTRVSSKRVLRVLTEATSLEALASSATLGNLFYSTAFLFRQVGA